VRDKYNELLKYKKQWDRFENWCDNGEQGTPAQIKNGIAKGREISREIARLTKELTGKGAII